MLWRFFETFLMKCLQECIKCYTFAPQKQKGRLAQLVQSVCLTSRGSGVRIPQRPQEKSKVERLCSFFLYPSGVVLCCVCQYPMLCLPTPYAVFANALCCVCQRSTFNSLKNNDCYELMATVTTYSSPSSRLISCNSLRIDCRRPIISEVSLAALRFLFSTAFAAAIFMPRTLSKL